MNGTENRLAAITSNRGGEQFPSRRLRVLDTKNSEIDLVQTTDASQTNEQWEEGCWDKKTTFGTK